MRSYLVFRLYGAMASWGQAAVGGDRPTARQPTRSALLGLLAAALGIRREQAGELQALADSVYVAVKHCAPTSLLRDYHTAQVPSHNKKVHYRHRKSELSEPKDKLNTVLSSRDYRCDGLWTIAVYSKANASVTLEALRDALYKPVFALCLGRKSCPLAAPVQAQLVDCSSLQEALDTKFPSLMLNDQSGDQYLQWLDARGPATYLWESSRDEIDCGTVITTHPWDEPVSRARWQFKQRVQFQAVGER